ncbi:hypothetical protein [Streptomyces wedmorensis]
MFTQGGKVAPIGLPDLDPADEKARRVEEVADRARAKFGPRTALPGSPAA